MARATILRRRLDDRSIGNLQETLDSLKGILASLGDEDDGTKDLCARIEALEARLEAAEARPVVQAPQPVDAPEPPDMGPLVDAIRAIEVQVVALRDVVRDPPRMKWHFTLHRNGDMISDVDAVQVEAAPGEERLEDVVEEIDRIAKILRETPDRYFADTAMQERYREVLDIQERAIS